MQSYRQNVQAVMDAADWPWPEHVLLDGAKAPRLVHSVDEFLTELQTGCHMDEIVVFPNGVEALGHADALDPHLRRAAGLGTGDGVAAEEDVGGASGGGGADSATTAYELLERLAAQGWLGELKGKIGYIERPGELESRAKGGPGMLPQWQSLVRDCPPEARGSTYIAELRMMETQNRNQRNRNRQAPPGGDGGMAAAAAASGAVRTHRRSALRRTMRERAAELGLDGRDMLYWDDYSEGTFIGGDRAGYALHVVRWIFRVPLAFRELLDARCHWCSRLRWCICA
eukprot:COSAG01_NODE_14441_length_1453_cov_3.726736_1_plen_284_part_01